MKQSRFNPALLGSLGVSVLVHVLVLAPLFVLVMSTPGASPWVDRELHVEDVEPPSPYEQPRLGLDAPNPSSLTWVGYEEYLEHIAAIAEFEQAAFTEHPGDMLPEMTATQEQTLIEVEQEPVQEPVEVAELAEPVEPVVPLEPEIEIETETVIAEAQEVPAQPIEITTAEPIVIPLEILPGDLPWVRNLLHAVERRPTQPESDARDEAALEDAPAEEAIAAETPREEAKELRQDTESAEQPQEPSPPTPSGTPGDTPRPQSDRESDSFSTIDADPRHWREGQPLAAHGVEVKPQRPHFTLLQRITQSPGNPLVLIRFRNDGVPASAAVIQTSGSSSVDASIEASLYRWRASGEAIEALETGQTFDVRIRIILNPRAAAEDN